MEKRIITIVTVMLLVLSAVTMSGCSETKKKEVVVLAAASLTDALDEIIAEYEKVADASITVSYAGSGELLQQIKGGVPCDIFVSASSSSMDQLEAEGYIETSTRVDLLTNTLTLIATVDAADTVNMDSLVSDATGMIAIGEPGTVPAGEYACQVFDGLGISDELEGKLIYSKDVRSVLNYVETGNVDCGFVYRTDAMMLNKNSGVIICDVDGKLHDAIVYPAAIIESAADKDTVTDFYNFIQSDFAESVYIKYGFDVK